MTRRYLLDTNILSQIIKPKPNKEYSIRLRDLVLNGAILYLSPVVYFEIKRSLIKRKAYKQLQEFYTHVEGMDYMEYREVDKAIWDEASELWAVSKMTGNSSPDDADILIAAQAKVLNALVVTNDKGIHRLIPDRCENWE